MKNEITIKDIKTELINAAPEYKTMVANINSKAEIIAQASSNFYKSHSQFMGVTVDVTAITPIRSIKHTLAEIYKTKNALQEAQINMQKNKIKLKMKEQELRETNNVLEKEMFKVEIIEIEMGFLNGQNIVQGAIRKLNFFVNQYESLLNHLGIDEVTEEMYEREENRYHIMTAMKQALHTARTRGGLIDEGNHIYLFELGINGATAQVDVFNYLKIENKMIADGIAPSHEMTMQWLETCADKFEGNAKIFAERRGFKILDEQSLTNTPKLQAAE